MEDRDTRGQFAKGNSARSLNNHRKKGSINKLTADVKAGIVHGAARHGADGKGLRGFNGYCEFLAAKHPKVYANLIGRLLPLQVNTPAFSAAWSTLS